MRYALIVALLYGCGDHHEQAQPVVASVLITANPVRVEVESKPIKVIKGIEIDLNNYEYKYRYEEEEKERDVRKAKEKSEKKDG